MKNHGAVKDCDVFVKSKDVEELLEWGRQQRPEKVIWDRFGNIFLQPMERVLLPALQVLCLFNNENDILVVA